jgi:carboxymethylenebutenolidase
VDPSPPSPDRAALRRAWSAAGPTLASIVLCWGSGCAPALHATAVAPAKLTSNVSHFESGGRRIRVDIYRPEVAGLRPAVIVVHGSSGVHSRIPNTGTRYAKALAEQGLIAFVVHYFDSTHTIRAGLSSEKKNYFTWLRVLSDATTWVGRYPGVDSTRVGMLGHSLGAFLAVGAGTYDQRISRVVLLGGALEPFLEGKLERMPPTLICHGDKDDEVPLKDAVALSDFLRARGWEVDLRVYPGEGHIFSTSAVSDVLTRAARFLDPELPSPVMR